jgi:hypothetical protein
MFWVAFISPGSTVPHTIDVAFHVQGCDKMMRDDATLLALAWAAHELRQLSTVVRDSIRLSLVASTGVGLRLKQRLDHPEFWARSRLSLFCPGQI